MSTLLYILKILTLINMNHIKAFALAKWATAEKLDLIEMEGEIGLV